MPPTLLRRLDPASSEYLTALRERLVIFDGATGTNLQRETLSATDGRGADVDECHEVLALDRPSDVEDLHRSFLEVGVDVIETDTFGALSTALADHGLASRAREINMAAAGIARRVADEFAAPGTPRWVAGSVGPGSEFPTLGQILYVDLRAAYEEQALALLEGGVDLVVVETVVDLLSAKAAINGARRAMAMLGLQVPLQVQVTVDDTGRMFPGTEVAAALSALDAMQVDVVGLNCATGPGLDLAVAHLCAHSRVPVAVMPSAGVPTRVGDELHYGVDPAHFADHLYRFVTEDGVEAVGGCCGTTPTHLAAVVERLRGVVPASRQRVHEPAVSSTYSALPFHRGAELRVVGERTNANSSTRFREAMRSGDWDTCVAMVREQATEGAHVVCICVDQENADGVTDMTELARRLCTESNVPLMIESTEPSVAEAALQWLGGRPVLRSVDLLEGTGEGTRLARFLRLAREYGAVVVCTCADEDGPARTSARKLHAARALYDVAVDRYGLDPSDLLVDPLALPLTTGTGKNRRDGLETIDALAAIKESLPGSRTIVELSNASHGLRPAARRALNSVFLDECVHAGLDAVIVDPSHVLAPSRIDERARQVCLDLVHDRRREGDDPLRTLMALFGGGVRRPFS